MGAKINGGLGVLSSGKIITLHPSVLRKILNFNLEIGCF